MSVARRQDLVALEHLSLSIVRQCELLGISQRGDVYLRTLLIHGGRSVVQQATVHAERASGWLKGLLGRRHSNIAAVAVANKNARVAWALLATGRAYEAAAGKTNTGFGRA